MLQEGFMLLSLLRLFGILGFILPKLGVLALLFSFFVSLFFLLNLLNFLLSLLK